MYFSYRSQVLIELGDKNQIVSAKREASQMEAGFLQYLMVKDHISYFDLIETNVHFRVA